MVMGLSIVHVPSIVYLMFCGIGVQRMCNPQPIVAFNCGNAIATFFLQDNAMFNPDNQKDHVALLDWPN